MDWESLHAQLCASNTLNHSRELVLVAKSIRTYILLVWLSIASFVSGQVIELTPPLRPEPPTVPTALPLPVLVPSTFQATEFPASTADQQSLRQPEFYVTALAGNQGENVIAIPEQPRASGDDSTLKKLSKQVEELEKKEKKRDEAEKKKAAAFPTFKITGFTQLDTAFYAQDSENRAVVGDGQDGTGFRRARLAVTGKVAETTGYQLEVDFATAGRPSFFDCYIDQSDLPLLGTVRVGQFCQPFSVDSLTGFRNLTFLERSLPFLALVPFRRVGISSSNVSEDERTAMIISTYRSGGFNNAPLGDDRFATDFGDVGGYAMSMRGTHLMFYDDEAEDRYLWHLGGGYNYSQLAANDAFGSGLSGNAGSPRPFYQARTTPEFGTLGYSELSSSFGSAVNGTPSFVDTGRYEADNFHLFGLESVTQWGAWGSTCEYMSTIVNSVAGPVVYQGGYAQLAYRLTGEHRVYDKRTGTLGRLKPNHDFLPSKGCIRGWGAWEVAGRYSIIDLTNPAFLNGHYYNSATNTFTASAASGAVGNGLLQDTTLGLTWFLNSHTKIQVNWIHAMLDNTRRGFSDASLYVSRFQVDF